MHISTRKVQMLLKRTQNQTTSVQKLMALDKDQTEKHSQMERFAKYCLPCPLEIALIV